KLDAPLDLLGGHLFERVAVLDLVLARHQQSQDLEIGRRLRPAHLRNSLLPMHGEINCKPSKSERFAVRALRACSLISSGLIPRALSRIARSFPRLILTAVSCPAVVPLRT